MRRWNLKRRRKRRRKRRWRDYNNSNTNWSFVPVSESFVPPTGYYHFP